MSAIVVVGSAMEWVIGRWAVEWVMEADCSHRKEKADALSIPDEPCLLADLERCVGVASVSPEAELSQRLVVERTAAFVPEQCRLRHLVRISRWLKLSHGLLGWSGFAGRTECLAEQKVVFVFLLNWFALIQLLR